jgi:hypothetical protein
MSGQPLHLAISGSRSIDDQPLIHSILDREVSRLIAEHSNLTLVLGDAKGVDSAALSWSRSRSVSRYICFADQKGFEFWQEARSMRAWPTEDESAELSSDWAIDGRGAGITRNRAMIHRSSLLIGIWDGESKGTAHCMAYALVQGLTVIQYGSDGPMRRLGDGGLSDRLEWRGPIN